MLGISLESLLYQALALAIPSSVQPDSQLSHPLAESYCAMSLVVEVSNCVHGDISFRQSNIAAVELIEHRVFLFGVNNESIEVECRG